LPGRELADARSGDERSQIVESLFGACQKSGGASIDHEFGADDGLQVLPPRLQPEANDPTEVGGIRDSESGVAE